jgi:hypothetical protein
MMPPSRPIGGAYASSLARDGMRWTRRLRDDSQRSRTVKSCGPGPPTLGSSLREMTRGRRWLKRPEHRGDHEAAVKTIARGKPDRSGWSCGDYAGVDFYPFPTPGCGCNRHPAFPAPSDFFEGRQIRHHPGEIAPRECGGVFRSKRRVGKGALAPCPPPLR